MANKKTTNSKRYSTRKNSGAQKTRRNRVRRILLSILGFVFVAVTIFFLVSRSGGQISIFENAIGSLISPVQNAASSITNKVKNFTSTWRNYNALQEDYVQLSFENEQLQMELMGAQEAIAQNESLQELLDAKPTYESLDPVYAKVIARDAGPWFKTFSVNRGTNHGVSVGMAVVNGDGLIGRVYEVGLNYAKVITIIDTRSRVACLMQRTRDNGIMRGQISDSDSTAQCYVYYLPNINSITPGDVVVTSGMDSVYPKGLKVGTVTALSLDAGSEGTYAVVTPSVDFQRIEDVFILRTVIETDDEGALPSLSKPTAAYQTEATPAPNSTPSPTPTSEISYWSYPTATPESASAASGNQPVGSLIEDAWAADNG